MDSTLKSFRTACAWGLLALSSAVLFATAGSAATAEKAVPQKPRVISAGNDKLSVDLSNHEVRISAEVTKDRSKPGIADWGKRGAAWFGCEGGKAQAFFIFTTKVGRAAIDKALREIGLTSRRQIGDKEVKAHTGLRPETKAEDYLDGDPLVIGVRFQKDGKLVERALEDFIAEKILVQGKEVVKPYTPHWIYHGTAEAAGYPSGCVSCPEDCWGGLVADNSVPVLTTDRWYKVDWEKMPPVGSKVELVFRSIYGPDPLSTLR